MIDLNNFGYDHIVVANNKAKTKLVDINEGRNSYFKTSLRAENETLVGIFPSDQLVIAARSGMGKTSKVISMVDDLTNPLINPIWQDKVIILWDSLEMVDWRNVLRMISRELNLPVKKILTEYAINLNKEKEQFLDVILTKFSHKPIFFSRVYPNVKQWENQKQTICERYPKHVIINVVDHTRLITKSNENKEEELITGLMNAGMRIKNKYNCINVFVSQMNRNIETSVNRKDLGKNLPVGTDIFGSDAVFQTADVVMLLHRPGYYGLTTFEIGDKVLSTGLSETTNDNLMIQRIAKNREGETPDLIIKHDLSVNKFYNYN
jgi:replicative DNA helicase